MKRTVRYNLLLLSLAILIATWGMSQTTLAPDQNPDYMVSQAKYVSMADSINSWHGTTPQETYKAIDWMADRQAAREQRRAFRRELRMERARNGYGWYYNEYGYNYPGYSRGYGYYYPVYSRNYGYYYHPYRVYRPGWNRNYWNLVPLAATAATVGWLLTR
ncbi:hypothetical protein [Longitalea arenae]|uniref:hypothetical protein n=1 Tax=Longitalea arenae TaxID=2812558 RepID=UPI00196770E8|nr:hypothetical protein [Longitalea arenae]